MRHQLRHGSSLFRSFAPLAGLGLVWTLGACAGQVPSNPAMVDAPLAAVDAPVVAADPGQQVSGKTMDYFAAIALPQAALATDGITPTMNATSDAAGLYQLLHVPTGSKLYLSTTRATYATTRNEVTEVAGVAVMQDLYAVSAADLRRQYTTLGLPVATGKAVVFINLLKNNGTPLEGVPPTDITLVDGAGAPVVGLSGPFFFNATGDLAPLTGTGAVATSTAYGGRARAGFLGVAPGNYTVKVNYPMGAGGIGTYAVPITTTADGAVLIKTGGAAGAGQTTPPTNPTFATDIYPRLQRAVTGGLACANCHTTGGPAAVLPFDLPAQATYDKLKATAGVVNLTTPAASLLLVKPLYEVPPAVQDHPNATFLTVDDPDYKLILLWITQGAKP